MAIPVNMFWQGPALGRLELACIHSFHRHGHPVILHAYEHPHNMPEFVEPFNASQIMSRNELFLSRHTNSPALGANRYRYLLIEAGMGLYADCDMYCLRPIEATSYVLGWEYARSVNNAILHYPAGSELSQRLLDHTARPDFIPPWLRRRERALLTARRRLGLPKLVQDMKWGVWGPRLLTHLVYELSLESEAKPIDYFFPFPGMHFPLLFETGVRVADLITSRSLALHLWNNMFKVLKIPKDVDPPVGSPLHEIYSSIH